MSKTRKEQIEDMLQDDPNDHELRYMLAMEHARGGDDEGAARTFRDLIERKPDYPPAYHMGARALQRLGRLDEAQTMLRQGIPTALKIGDAHAAGEMQELLSHIEAGE